MPFSILQTAEKQLSILRNLQPFLIDVSLREAAIGSGLGHTLEEKKKLFLELQAFGLSNIVVGSLNYSFPELPEVDDDFMVYLRDANIDRSGCFALTSVGTLSLDGTYVPDISELKLKTYEVPNTIHELAVCTNEVTSAEHLTQLCERLVKSIQWLEENIKGEGGKGPRIVLNIVDGCQAFAEQPLIMMHILKVVSELRLEAFSFEDAQGTFLPFQVGAFVAAARNALPPEMKILVHIHSGAGVENASVLEAILNGADGAWGAMAKAGPVNGHASLGELIANLVRVGNPFMQTFKLKDLGKFCQVLQPRYCVPLTEFHQTGQRRMNLPAEAIGLLAKQKICPVVSDPSILKARVSEILAIPLESISEESAVMMIRLMREDLRKGLQIFYDHPENAHRLYERALSELTPTTPLGELA